MQSKIIQNDQIQAYFCAFRFRPYNPKLPILMGSMHTGLEEEKNGLEKIAIYYAEPAKGVVGLIVSGGNAPNIKGWTGPFSVRMSTKKHKKHHKIITEAMY